MRNFKGLHKCATGAVINTEDFNNTNNPRTMTAVSGLLDTPWEKQKKKQHRQHGKKACKKGTGVFCGGN